MLTKNLFITVISILLFAACGSPGATEEIIENQEPAQQETVQTTPTLAPEVSDEIWAVYEGHVGLYEQHVIMELSIIDNNVTGNYFYARHQKYLDLKGTFDPTSNKFQIVESYKGESTGYMEFEISKEGILEGIWKKSQNDSEEESLRAELLPINKSEYTPEHSHFKEDHTIFVYNGEGQDEENVTNVLKVNRLNDNYISFYYSVICTNAHLGNLEGLAKFTSDGNAVFEPKSDEEDECKVVFSFSENTVTIVEEGNCFYYKGARAYFDGELTKVK